MRAKLELVIVELDVAKASWTEMSLMVMRLMAIRLKVMRLGRKFKKGLGPKLYLSLFWTFLPLELN